MVAKSLVAKSSVLFQQMLHGMIGIKHSQIKLADVIDC